MVKTLSTAERTAENQLSPLHSALYAKHQSNLGEREMREKVRYAMVNKGVGMNNKHLEKLRGKGFNVKTKVRRIAQKAMMNTSQGAAKSSRIDSAVHFAENRKKAELIDIANYNYCKGKPAGTNTIRAVQKRRLGVRELIR